VEGSLRAKNKLDSSSRFNKIPVCDGQTDGHTTTATTALAKRRVVTNVLSWHHSFSRHVDRRKRCQRPSSVHYTERTPLYKTQYVARVRLRQLRDFYVIRWIFRPSFNLLLTSCWHGTGNQAVLRDVSYHTVLSIKRIIILRLRSGYF